MSKLVDPYEMPETRLTTPNSLEDSVKNYSATKISTIGASDQSLLPTLQESSRKSDYLSLEEEVSKLQDRITELEQDLHALILKVFKLEELVK